MKKFLRWFVLVLVVGVGANAAESTLRLEGYTYPFPVKIFEFSSQQQPLEMAYMDLQPAGDPRGTVVLLHGKNFSGAYWEETARALQDKGWRVIMPDQIGFGKSSKPERYQFSIPQLAFNTRELLKRLGVKKSSMLGHSMGGMIATRFALMYPDATRSLVLVDPLGLEDWKAKGVPYTSIDAAYQRELKQTPESLRAYQRENYYDGQWSPEYDRWVEPLTLFLKSLDYPRMAWNQAQTSEMIYGQPVCYEFGNLTMPVLLMVGERDRTAPGKELLPPARRATLGDYPKLAQLAGAAIPHSKIVELQGVGHLPMIQDFSHFISPLEKFLELP